MTQDALIFQALTKKYKGTKKTPGKLALDSIDLTIPRGSIFGLLGPNGAGKSTLINILAGLVTKTSGKAIVWGYDLDDDSRAVRSSIGVVPQEINFDPFRPGSTVSPPANAAPWNFSNWLALKTKPTPIRASFLAACGAV
jgi:ABC-2 type transport system ATP-binding protein